MVGAISKLYNKKILYTLCFLVLNFLDCLRFTQPGNIGMAAANCTGLVVMVIIGSAYPLRDFLNKFSYIWSGFCILLLAVVILSGQRYFFGEIHIWRVETAILNIWWIGIFAKYLIGKIWKEKTISIRPNLLGWLCILLTVLMTLSRSGRLWPIWFLLMFGMFYVTKYSLEDRNQLVEGMIDGTILSFFCLQIFAYGFRPYDEPRYLGAFSGSNITCLHYMVVYCMVLFKLHLLETKGAKKAWKLFYLTGAGGLLGFMILTMGRTSWVASLVMTFFYGVFVVRKKWEKKWLPVLLRGAALVLAMVITFPLVFLSVRWLPTILHHPIWYDGEYATDKVHSFDPPDSWKYVTWEEVSELLLHRIWSVLKVSIASPLVVEAAAADYEVVEKIGSPDMDDGLRVRMSIYKAYWDDLTWFGHPQGAGRYLIEGQMSQGYNHQTGQREPTPYYSTHAQNVWLEVAYFYGIPAGIVFLLITFVMLFQHLTKILQKDRGNIIPFFVVIMFFIFGTMELNWVVGQMSLFLLFFVHHPQIAQWGVTDAAKNP